jgi:uncharacterized protein
MRALLWSNQDPWHTEMAFVELGDGGLTAQGVQLRTAPEPLRLDYRLDARDGFTTTELALSCTVEGTVRELVLRREPDGWATAAGPVPGLEEALDIDILDSPLTNTMPVRRHGIGDGGSVDLTVAFVRVPELAVVVSRQRYEHLEQREAGSLVRYTSLDSGFTADLELDGDGFVVDYPGLARRLPT